MRLQDDDIWTSYIDYSAQKLSISIFESAEPTVSYHESSKLFNELYSYHHYALITHTNTSIYHWHSLWNAIRSIDPEDEDSHACTPKCRSVDIGTSGVLLPNGCDCGREVACGGTGIFAYCSRRDASSRCMSYLWRGSHSR